MAKFLCFLFLSQITLIWAGDLNSCMTEFKEKFGKMQGFVKRFMQAKSQCMQPEECGEALKTAGFGECWSEEEAIKLEMGLAAMMEAFEDIMDKAAEMVLGECPRMPPPTKLWTFEELFGKAGNHFHFKNHQCIEAFFHKFLPRPSQVCIATCILNKIKDDFPLPSLAEVQEKLDWLEDPDTALPKFMEEMDLKRAAMCIVNSCDLNILLGVVERSGLKGILIGKMAIEDSPKLGEKCTCLWGVAEKNGVDLSGLESLDCDNLMGFLKERMVCAHLVKDKFQVVKDVLSKDILVLSTTQLRMDSPRDSPLLSINDTKEAFRKDSANFALEVYRLAQRNRQPWMNSIFSPISISIALGMLMNGAAGASRDQIKAKIASSLPSQKDINSAYQWLMETLREEQATNDYQLHSANALFVREGFQLAQEFLDHVTQGFLGKVESKDFATRANQARREINEWVEDQTNDKITDLLPRRSLNPSTALVLVNAIYFKAEWKDPFTDRATVAPGPFYSLADIGHAKMVPMMSQRMEVQYYGDRDNEVVAIPYKGEKTAMYIILPKIRNGLVFLEESLTQEYLEKIQKGLTKGSMKVTIPKFIISQALPLKQVLMSMGINDIFGSQANLTGLTNSPNDISVSGAFHKAFIEVNEQGTEAAAATGVVSFDRSALPKEFIADHPFLFFIRHETTGQILFMGSLIHL